MRLIMMGTGPFAVPTFGALYRTPHEVTALVTQPLRPGPAGKQPPAPMRDVAIEHGTPILDPQSVNTPEAQAALAALQPDALIVADYGQILAPQTLGIARLGGVNLHGSLLPKYRGAAPINWALHHGDTRTGVTVIHMTPRVDAGPCLAQAAVEIGAEETAPELEVRLAELGAPLVCETLARLERGEVRPIEQSAEAATGARRLRKTDGEVLWSRTAEQLRNQIRALEPWPRTSTSWHRTSTAPLRLILGHAQVRQEPAASSPGTVVAIEKDAIVVATGEGCLAIDCLQPAGKRMMTAAEFLRGHPVSAGDRLSPAENTGK